MISGSYKNPYSPQTKSADMQYYKRKIYIEEEGYKYKEK